MFRSVSLFVAAFALIACSSSSTSPPSAAAAAPPSSPDDGSDTPPADPPPPPTDACGTVAKSLCTPANPGSVIRGIVTFDKTKYTAAKPPTLRVFLHHQWTLMKDEDKHGGHPHAFKSFDVDVTKGEVSFSLDLCELGTAMWSEENCGFNLVAVMDETGDNDPDVSGNLAFIVKQGTLAKLTPVEVSCHAASQCLQINADCADGETCTTYTPITSCKCSTTSCKSDDAYCKP